MITGSSDQENEIETKTCSDHERRKITTYSQLIITSNEISIISVDRGPM